MTKIVTLLLSAALSAVPAAAAPPPDARTSTSNFGAVLTGTIGSHPVEMYLEGESFGSPDDPIYSLWGYYYYTKPGAVARAQIDGLSIEGRMDAAGMMDLEERTDMDVTGHLRGRLTVDAGGGRPVARIEGTWTSQNGGRQFAFSLAEARHAKVGYTIASESIGELQLPPDEGDDGSEAKLPYAISCEVPRLSGVSPAVDAAFNKVVDEAVAKTTASFKEDAEQPLDGSQNSNLNSTLTIYFDVAYASPSLVSIRFHEYYSPYWYLAWPLRTRWGITFDLKTGREVTLAEALGPRGEREQWRRLERLGKGKEWETSTLADDRGSIGWNVREDGLSIYYLADRREGGNVELFVPRAPGVAPLARTRR